MNSPSGSAHWQMVSANHKGVSWRLSSRLGWIGSRASRGRRLRQKSVAALRRSRTPKHRMLSSFATSFVNPSCPAGRLLPVLQ
jgi:hypothetical protein